MDNYKSIEENESLASKLEVKYPAY